MPLTDGQDCVETMFDPERGYPTVVPYVRYSDPDAASTWLSAVLGAREGIRLTTPDGTVAHIEMLVGDEQVLTLGPSVSPAEPPCDLDGVQSMTLVFVDDVPLATDRARERGATVIEEPVDKPWGLRQAVVVDPGGHAWELTTHERDVAPEEWGAVRSGAWIDG